MSIQYFVDEAEARSEIIKAIKPIYGNSCVLFVAERNSINIGLREVIFVARVTKDDANSEKAVNELFKLQLEQPIERLEWQGTKMDFLNDNETEYLMIKAVVTNG